uniref:VWFD domain-containing protein n=1 Tax=Leptobrachium leishanense TaxID=445787 RepID=A0A8C5WM78_9ANUR
RPCFLLEKPTKNCPKNSTYQYAISACQKTCRSLSEPDLTCSFSIRCVPGCLCPDGLVLSNNGSCIPKEECPCLYNGEVYHNGESIQQDCNTWYEVIYTDYLLLLISAPRTRLRGYWSCSSRPVPQNRPSRNVTMAAVIKECGRTCMVYGEGHYVTYDGKRFDFSGDCEYTVTQDYCASNTANGTFRVITENIPCGSTGATCTKSLTYVITFQNFELKLSEGSYEVVERDTGSEVPYQVRKMGIYLVIEHLMIWFPYTLIMQKNNLLCDACHGNVCGLCGNYDGSVSNDFMTRSLSVVVNVQEFANSWKASPTCPDAEPIRDPCVANPYRRTWSLRHCSIIMSPVFSKCHGKVDPSPFHESCVHDTCACDSGGDCECFCTAVAAYAAACNEAGICVAWRTPEICPLFCDYYNPEGECEWHYKPCGAPCMKTCRNPSGNSQHFSSCYPKCPKSRPYFDEDIMKCVALANCGCYDDDGKRYNVGDMVPSYKNCESWYVLPRTIDTGAVYLKYNSGHRAISTCHRSTPHRSCGMTCLALSNSPLTFRPSRNPSELISSD